MNMVKECVDGDNIFVIRNFCTPAECTAFITQSEQSGYEDPALVAPTHSAADHQLHDNAQLILEDRALAAEWWRRAADFLPQRVQSWTVASFNERFRFYRYDAGQRFAPHVDTCFRRENGEHSQLTFMLYLNSDFEGGATNFYHRNWMPRASVVPERGMALVFGHRQLHEGAPLASGRKYILRTDVMYR